MRKVIRWHQRRKARATAALWVAKVDRGLSAAEQEGLLTWLAESPLHRETMRDYDALWQKLDVLSEGHEIAATLSNDDESQARTARPTVTSWLADRFHAAAAALFGRTIPRENTSNRVNGGTDSAREQPLSKPH